MYVLYIYVYNTCIGCVWMTRFYIHEINEHRLLTLCVSESLGVLVPVVVEFQIIVSSFLYGYPGHTVRYIAVDK